MRVYYIEDYQYEDENQEIESLATEASEWARLADMSPKQRMAYIQDQGSEAAVQRLMNTLWKFYEKHYS